MFVIHIENAPDSIRGELSLFAQEISPFTFVSNTSAKTREMLWKDIIKINQVSAVMVYNDKNEQGYSIRKTGYPTYSLTDFDGIQLIVKPENSLIKSVSEKLWAKLNPYKSLIDHMLETGITANCLMRGLFKHLISVLANTTSIREEVLIPQITFICAIHDIGKAHPVFQGRNEDTCEILKAQGLHMDTVSSTCRHERYAEEIIESLFKEDTKGDAVLIKEIISLHHQKEKNPVIPYPVITADINDRWSQIQTYIYHFVKEVFEFPTINLTGGMKKTARNIFLLKNGILGILITSDWIASNEGVFDSRSYREYASMADYLADKTKQLQKFLVNEKLLYQGFPDTHNFSDLFSFDARPIQKDVENIVKNNNVKLMLIESGCGSGKTEAALYAASVLGNKNGLSGIYMGLPTGASAEAIQNRVDCFMDKLNMFETRLYTSRSMLLRDQEETPLWTDISRQRLLTPSAVGTVDQVMTVARFVRFESVRMAGLSSKVLVIDEIHAYDAFMMATIERLIQICDVIGVPVILLSATLPASTKKRLFSAITKNKNIDVHNGYPLISYITEKNEFYEQESLPYESDKQIVCERCPILDNHNAIADLAIKNINDGGCECIIMNTVSEAIAVYDAIKEKKESNCEVLLYHARMPEITKDIKMKQLLTWLGKNRSKRPEKAIIVGTQVLEQSLDVDFDYLITAICPIDLLIQRIGRYHRHTDAGTIREKMNIKNIVHILTSTNMEYGNTEYIYDKDFLIKTEEIISKTPLLSIPSCIPEMINQVYDALKIQDIIDKSASNLYNINIFHGFELYNQRGDLSDRHIAVRKNDGPERTPVAILSSEELSFLNNDTKGKNTKAAIDLYKHHVVSAYEYQLKDFDYITLDKGIFKGVKVITDDNAASYSEDKVLEIDEEYGLRILKNSVLHVCNKQNLTY